LGQKLLHTIHPRLKFCQIVQFLLDNGADPDPVDDWQVTPLHNAAGNGHVEVVKELCEAGADTEVRSSKGKSPVEIARDRGKLDVIPILQKYSVTNRQKGKGRQKQKQQSNGTRGVVKVRWADKAANVRNAGGGSNGRDLSLPGQVGGGGGGMSREESARFEGEKSNLHRQLKMLEKQEEMYKLSKEHSRAREQFEIAKGKYDR